MLIRPRAIPFGVSSEMSSGEANALNEGIEGALDKRAGQVDQLASVVSLSGAGRILQRYGVGPDSNATFFLGSASTFTIIDVVTLTDDRNYVFQAYNGVAQAGDVVTVLNRSTFSVSINDSDAGQLLRLAPTQANGESSWCDLVYTGSTWVAVRSAKPPTTATMAFTSNYAWIVPYGITKILVVAFGGGGGGGSGAPGNMQPSTLSSGGGGGCGAMQRAAYLDVTPTATVLVAIGAGGTSDAGGSPTTVGSLTFLGGQAGAPGAPAFAAGTFSGFAPGGCGVATDPAPDPYLLHSATILGTQGLGHQTRGPGAGGSGFTSDLSGTLSNGSSSVEGHAGGEGAGPGAPQGGYRGGGGGGGGGGGPRGPGGRTYSGRGGESAGTPLAGQPGASAAANTGAGGGGGTGGAFGSGGGGTAGAGGAGGSGYAVIIPLR